MVMIKAESMTAFVSDIFAKAGTSRAEADRLGKALVVANLTGHDSHGVQRVPRYLQWLAEGVFVADRVVKIINETPVYAVIDGLHGFGQTVAPQAVAIGLDKCRQSGLSMVALRNAGHIGRVGDYAETAAAAGFVSIHFVNAYGSSLVAPFGGVDRRFSTAPYCVGVPRQGEPPLILDFATSIVAEGKVLNASFGGKKIPEDALVSSKGAMSSDPHVLYGDYTPSGARDYRKGDGAIRAFGDHKGSGLALMCELLGGSLTGNGATEEGKRFANGMLSFYVDPKRIDPEGFFPADVSKYTNHVKSSRPIVPGGEVLVPGEPELRMRAERGKNGLPIPDDTWAAIVAAARSVGLDEARVAKAMA